MPLDDQIYPAQVWTIQELEGSYTIVGRGANRVLEGYEDLLNLFICTAPNIRLKRATVSLRHRRKSCWIPQIKTAPLT